MIINFHLYAAQYIVKHFHMFYLSWIGKQRWKLEKARYCSACFICKERSTERLIELAEVTLLENQQGIELRFPASPCNVFQPPLVAHSSFAEQRNSSFVYSLENIGVFSQS